MTAHPLSAEVRVTPRIRAMSVPGRKTGLQVFVLQPIRSVVRSGLFVSRLVGNIRVISFAAAANQGGSERRFVCIMANSPPFTGIRSWIT